MLLNSREFKFLKNYRNVYGKSSAKRDYRDENVFLVLFIQHEKYNGDIVTSSLKVM